MLVICGSEGIWYDIAAATVWAPQQQLAASSSSQQQQQQPAAAASSQQQQLQRLAAAAAYRCSLSHYDPLYGCTVPARQFCSAL
jgi:hypothetical protein